MKSPSESSEQISFVLWFKFNYPDVTIFSIPNGGSRNKAEAMKLKKEGILAGVSDLFVPEWRLWIEMKRIKGGTVSKEQKSFMIEMERVGYQCYVARGFEQAKEVIDVCLKHKH